jgi:thioredoxin-related protein
MGAVSTYSFKVVEDKSSIQGAETESTVLERLNASSLLIIERNRQKMNPGQERLMYKRDHGSRGCAAVLLRSTSFFLLLFLNGFCAYLWSADNKSIPWFTDIHQASLDAVAANKPMMLEFRADRCDPCKLMDEQVFPDPSVIEGVSRGFVPVRINADRTQALKNKYAVTVLPTIVFTDSYGTEIFRHSAYIDADVLSLLLRALPVDVTEINSFDRELTKDKYSFDAMDGLATELRKDSLYRLSNEYYNRALRLKMAKRDPRGKELILEAVAFNDIKLQESGEAAKIFESCLKEFPSSPSTPMFLLGLGQAYALSGDDDEARSVLQAVIGQYPNSDLAQRAREGLDALR